MRDSDSSLVALAIDPIEDVQPMVEHPHGIAHELRRIGVRSPTILSKQVVVRDAGERGDLSS